MVSRWTPVNRRGRRLRSLLEQLRRSAAEYQETRIPVEAIHQNAQVATAAGRGCGRLEGRHRRASEFGAVKRKRHNRGILDTSTVILLPRLHDANLLPAEPLITSITLAELTAGPLLANSAAERAARQAHVQQAEADFDPLPFDAAAARAFGRVAASLRAAGRKTNARAYDAMIAAIALAQDLPIYTCNAGDFVGIDGLTIISVPVRG